MRSSQQLPSVSQYMRESVHATLHGNSSHVCQQAIGTTEHVHEKGTQQYSKMPAGDCFARARLRAPTHMLVAHFSSSGTSTLTCADCAECSTSRTRRPRRGLVPPSTWHLRSSTAANATMQRCGCCAKFARNSGAGRAGDDDWWPRAKCIQGWDVPKNMRGACRHPRHWRHGSQLHA